MGVVNKRQKIKLECRYKRVRSFVLRANRLVKTGNLYAAISIFSKGGESLVIAKNKSGDDSFQILKVFHGDGGCAFHDDQNNFYHLKHIVQSEFLSAIQISENSEEVAG